MAATQDAQELFNSHDSAVAPLGLVVTEGARELGEKINAHLVSWATPDNNPRGTFLVENECPRFSSGDSKGLIRSTIRGDDLFFLVDVGNYSCTDKLFGKQNAMSPDDHFQDLKRLIQAASGKAHRISVIMPLLYGGRQHRRSYRESLDCACALQELQAMGVSNIVTFDAHDSRVQNAVPLMGFDNVMPYYQVLKALTRKIPDLKLNREHFMVVSPDEGAMNRNMYYASVLEVDLGMFYKRRDYSRVVNGRNPIVAHEYLGASVEGKDIFITDDIISSGESMLDIAYELKKQRPPAFSATLPILSSLMGWMTSIRPIMMESLTVCWAATSPTERTPSSRENGSLRWMYPNISPTLSRRSITIFPSAPLSIPMRKFRPF